MKACTHCGRSIVHTNEGWIDPQAKGDDSVWRETCDKNDSFTAEHEPSEAEDDEDFCEECVGPHSNVLCENCHGFRGQCPCGAM